MKCSLGISNFLEEISSLSLLLFFSVSLHWSLRKAFLSLFAILWNSAFKWLYLSFSPLLFTFLFPAICKASSDSHFDFLPFFFLGIVLINTLFLQHKRSLYTWTSPNGQHWNQIDYILCSQSWRSSIQSAKTRLEADCGSDHELLIAKFRLKLKKVGKTTRPFSYDLNQIPYDYTEKVRNRFKGLDLIECLMNCGQRFMKTVQPNAKGWNWNSVLCIK